VGNKIFAGTLIVLVVGGFSFAAAHKKSTPPRPGVALANHGRTHVAQAAKPYGGSEPPTSGDHAEPVNWGVYSQPVPDINVIHNMEHGGVYISYKPDLPKDQIDKINALFGTPFSKVGFSPSKVVVAPRATNDAPIILSSWDREQKLNAFDELAMYDYYFRNIGKSPEPGAK
jgi:hypothetical protein